MVPESASLTTQELVLRHHADVYRYAYHLAGTVHQAEDLCQQTFLLAHERMHQLRDGALARRWLFAILRNCFLKARERRRPLDDALTLDRNWEDHADADASPGFGGRFLRHEDEACDPERLHAALQELPAAFRVVVLMYFFEDRSYREIADELGLPPGTVMSRLSRGKQYLREQLQPAAQRRPEP